MALEAQSKGQKVCTLGELIHNPQIVNQLQNAGIRTCSSADDLSQATVVVRSHGITLEEETSLLEAGNNLIDATCPYVKRIQQLVASAANEGYQVLILGNAEHPEVVGIKSYGKGHAIVVNADSPLDKLESSKLCLVSQTTENVSALQDMVARLVPISTELQVFNTICIATKQRQEAAISLARDSDLMIIIGGRSSSNTGQLTKLCGKYCPSLQIETSGEMEAAMFEGRHRIGITAGASTPTDAILDVYNKIKEIIGDPDRASCIGEIPLFKEESC
jgi:(E)-4-hydroxy-3-methyl-but-2-enyl pyrophosphate reductase